MKDENSLKLSWCVVRQVTADTQQTPAPVLLSQVMTRDLKVGGSTHCIHTLISYNIAHQQLLLEYLQDSVAQQHSEFELYRRELHTSGLCLFFSEMQGRLVVQVRRQTCFGGSQVRDSNTALPLMSFR